MKLPVGVQVHMVGVCGVGMAGVARLLAARGHVVSGCDSQLNELSAALEKAGVTLHKGHSVEHIKDLPENSVLVVTSAVSPDEPEIVAGEKEKQGDAERALHAEGKGASERNSQNADNEIYVNNGSNTDLNRDFSSQQDPNVDPSTEDAFLREMEERRAKHEERARTREQSKKPKRRSR